MKTFLFTSLFFVASATMGMASPDLPSPTALPSLPSFQVYADAANQTLGNPIEELGKLSPQCQAALLSVVVNPEFFLCIPIPALLPLTPVLLDPSALPDIMKDPVNKLPPLLEPVLEGLCAAPKCSDEGVATSLKAVKDGCKSDADNPLIKLAIGAITFYSPVRDSVCFKTNKDEFCVFDTLKKVFSLPAPPVKVTGTFIDNVAFAKPKDICTPCNKAIINTILNYIDADTNQCVEYLASINVPVALLPFAKIGVALKCGFQFVDGDVGHPESTDPNDFDYQLSAGQGALQSGASNLQGIGLMTMIGALVSTLMFYL